MFLAPFWSPDIEVERQCPPKARFRCVIYYKRCNPIASRSPARDLLEWLDSILARGWWDKWCSVVRNKGTSWNWNVLSVPCMPVLSYFPLYRRNKQSICRAVGSSRFYLRTLLGPPSKVLMNISLAVSFFNSRNAGGRNCRKEWGTSTVFARKGHFVTMTGVDWETNNQHYIKSELIRCLKTEVVQIVVCCKCSSKKYQISFTTWWLQLPANLGLKPRQCFFTSLFWVSVAHE